jgi:predicted nucleic acid-binding protein
VPGPAVVNASPLILLAKAGRLELLRALGRDLIVPDAVAEELRAKGSDDPVVQSVGNAAWLRVLSVPATPDTVVAWRLGAGESAVLTCALEYADPLVVLDDREGRRCAASHGIAVIGTIGVALLAKDEGAIPLVAPVLDELIAAGMHVSDALLARALHLAGEKPSESV